MICKTDDSDAVFLHAVTFICQVHAVSMSVCMLVTWVNCATTAKQQMSQCGDVRTSVDPRNHVLDGRTHWHQLANTIKRSVPSAAMWPYVSLF